MIQKNFLKVPKKLLKDSKFLKQTPNCKLIIIYIILHQDFIKKDKFWLENMKFCDKINIDRTTLWRNQLALKKMGIKIKKHKNRLWLDLKKFIHTYVEHGCTLQQT